uniref:Palmitoyltransferase n=1 Tax=Ditylum brightwellii TaxID=49249 RepID=A0A7S4V6W9_9STRA
MSSEKVHVRSHGCMKPYNWMQVGTWILLPLLLLQFFFFASPLLPLAASIPCSIVVFFFGALTAYKAIKTTITDPADSHSQKKTQGANFTDEEKAESGEEVKYCFACETNVNTNAVHCRTCRRCIEGYDHHCPWLNNCVGGENYQLFFETLVSLSLFLFSQSAVLIGIIAAFYAGWDDGQTSSTEKRAKDWFGANQPHVVIGFNIGFLTIDLIAALLILQLLFLHISLRRKGLTTYQYLIKLREIKRIEAMHQKEINDRRAHYIKKANEEGNSWEKMKLVVGGWRGCGCIDPITNGSVDDTSSPDGSMPDASINRDVIGSSSLDSWNYMLLQGSAVHG